MGILFYWGFRPRGFLIWFLHQTDGRYLDDGPCDGLGAVSYRGMFEAYDSTTTLGMDSQNVGNHMESYVCIDMCG